MRKIFKLSLGVVLIFLGVSSCSNIEEKFSPNTLIPRSELFAAPDRYCPHLSPDGHFISYIARSGNELELKIESIPDRKPVKSFKVKGCIGTYYYEWCYTNKHIVVPQDNGGDENDYIVCLNIETGEAKKITQFRKISQIDVISPYFPEEVIISNNDRVGEFFDYYKVNIVTGKCEKIFENNEYFRVCFNKKFQLKILQKILSNGDIQNLTPSKELIFTIPADEAATNDEINVENDNYIYTYTSKERDKRALVKIDVKTKKIEPVFLSDKADVEVVQRNPLTFEPALDEVNYLKSEFFPLNKSAAENLAIIRKQFSGQQFKISQATLDNLQYMIMLNEPDKVPTYYLFNAKDKSIKVLFSAQSSLEKYHFQKTEPIVIKSRDGLDLVCYLTLAEGSVLGKPTPLVAFIHGGPQDRDRYEFCKTVKWLANRGYSVLQINYRGSAGFGKSFLRGMDKKLENSRQDIIDAIQWTIDQGIADKNKIAIMGGSWGGYSTLAGMTFHPDFFCCGISICGVSNLITFISSMPEKWHSSMSCIYNWLGNPKNPKEAEYLKSVSPLFHKDNIKRPLLIFHGANDTRALKAESGQMVAALKGKIPVAYVLYSDEGHGFMREPNEKSYMAFSEKFLSKFLGGRCEHIRENELEDSSHQILEGKEILEFDAR